MTLVGLEDKDGPWIICDSFIRDWEKDILHIYHIYIHHYLEVSAAIFKKGKYRNRYRLGNKENE